jgi:hypothetical protein
MTSVDLERVKKGKNEFCHRTTERQKAELMQDGARKTHFVSGRGRGEGGSMLREKRSSAQRM